MISTMCFCIVLLVVKLEIVCVSMCVFVWAGRQACIIMASACCFIVEMNDVYV